MKAKLAAVVVVTIVALVATSYVFAGEKELDPKQEDVLLAGTRALTYGGKRSGEGYFSEDGEHFVFQSERDAKNPFYQIYIMNLQDGETHRVSPGTGKTTCAFFRPGSDDVMYASTHLDPKAEAKQKEEIDFRRSGKERRYSWDYDEHFEIFAAKRDGSDTRRLTDATGYDAEGSYSPSGDKIVFCSTRDAYPVSELSPQDQKRIEVDVAYFGEIYIMNADGSGVERLTDWAGYDGGPFFSPDGARIIWRHFDESGMLADIYTMKVDGSDVQRLTDFESMCWAPYYHPSGEYVIFTSNKLGFSNFELYIVDAMGQREPVQVTHTDGFDGLPVFSPDGRRLAWSSNRTSSGKTQIFLSEWNHSGALVALAASSARGAMLALSAAISADDMRTDVAYLASDKLEGRMTGTDGARQAAAYIEERLQQLGIEPVVDDGYQQAFPFTSGVKVIEDESSLVIETPDGKQDYVVNQGFRPLGFSDSGDIEAGVVFAGYGLKVPGDRGHGYDSYEGLDVKDKIVMVLRYVPEEVEVDRRAELNRYSGLRYKAMLARDRGAKGLLVVAGPNSPDAGELVGLRHDQSYQGSGIVVASVSDAAAYHIMAAAGKDMAEIQAELDVENPHFEGQFDIPDVTVRLSAKLVHEKKTGYNVVGLIPPAGERDDAEYIIIGAHYDHIGHGEIGSLARKGEEGQIHNGADGNASGTALVLELAAALADGSTDDAPPRGVIVALWSGGELGIIGSNYFAGDSPVALDKVAGYLNFDMVGRLRDNKLMVQGVGSSSVWPEIIEKRNVAAGFNIVLQEDPYLPTDVTAFYPRQIPVLNFFTGSHEDYNRPTDDAETLAYEGMERIGQLALKVINDLITADARPDYVKVERSKQDAGGHASLRAYVGTIPDYATDGTDGVKLSGVSAGGPADKAGLQGGDVIVEFAGRKIANIHDYSDALDAVKIGRPVRVVVMREGKRVEVEIVPEARD